ncbi:hypothetical protein MICAH_3200001 [Microcystis aeruginosa PCC 9809]|nr:hypothetical protein MICAH_3200001 [Microcystis aeruginosa PCC 9809]
MAFLHRVINGGGVLEREYAIGSDRMDLCLQYKDVILGIELKVWRDKKRNPQADGIEQLGLFGLCYAMDGGYKGCNPYIERHLAIFVNCF